MRIRTATAAAFLLTAAVLGSAGTALADEHNWSAAAYDYSNTLLKKHENKSDNDTNSAEQFSNTQTNVTDNNVRAFATGTQIGKLIQD
ncbi:hypothetical protein FM076_17600 [Streptomyces albus subsp. chlorinus]|uniref:hypothetical protein n=1 Tax=Streptomyces albus TaxID=1888 RepID=UPI00156FD799|nr:hypothetical protein [Streptomyces albus]NSC22888.1 hypothetical protein [Streptomyces albus subsp. chlorinus]